MATAAIAPPGQPDSRVIDATTTLLANNGVYTSNGYRIQGWNRIVGLCDSDQSGSLQIDQSVDGTNWDYTSTIAITASTTMAFDIILYGGWVRIRFTNTGGSTQTVFRLTTKVAAY